MEHAKLRWTALRLTYFSFAAGSLMHYQSVIGHNLRHANAFWSGSGGCPGLSPYLYPKMKTSRAKLLSRPLIPAFILFLICLPGSVDGQMDTAFNSPRSPAKASDTSDDEIFTLDPFEIVEEEFGYGATFSLSGTRVATRLRDLPRQVNVITAELAEDTNSTRVDDAVRYVSSTDFDEGDHRESTSKASDRVASLRLRGFQISTLYRNFNPTHQMPWGPFLDRIEVVKGPASTLYGRAAPGGLVNVITKRPQFVDKTVAKVTAGIVNVESFRALVDHQGSFEIFERPLGYRIVAGVQLKDGVKDKNRDDIHGVLVSLDWKLSDSDSLIIEFESANERGRDAVSLSWKTRIPDVRASITPRSFPENRKFNPRPTDDFGEVWTDKIYFEYRRRLTDHINLQLSYEHGERDYMAHANDFEEIRAAKEVYARSSTYNNVTDEVYVNYQRRRQTHTTDGFNGNLFIKFGPKLFRNELLIGGTIYDEDFSLFTEYVASPGVTRSGLKFFPPSRVLITRKDLETFDFPGKATVEPDDDNNNLPDYAWHLSEDSDRQFRNRGFYVANTSVLLDNRIRLLAGIRFDHMEQGQDTLRVIQDRSGDFIERIVAAKASQDLWTVQLAAMVNLSESLGWYISRAESAVQQFNFIREKDTPPAVAKPTGPLTGTGWETGIKFGLFGKNLNGAIAYFQSVERNRETLRCCDRFGVFGGLYKAWEVEGGEFDLVFQPVPNWQTVIFGAYMNVNRSVLDFNEPEAILLRPDYSVPRLKGGFFSKYSFDEGPLRRFEIGLGMEVMDDSRMRTNAFWAPNDRKHLKGYWVFDLMLAYKWHWRESDWRVQFNIDNLFDKRYFAGGSSYGLPRWGEVTVRVSF